MFQLLFSKKEKHFLILDLGTEAVKTLFCKKSDGKIIILGNSLQYFDQFSVFNSYGDFERDVLAQAISKAIKEIGNQINFRSERIFLALPAHVLKGRVVFQNFKRERGKKIISQNEEKTIFQEVLKETKKEVAQTYSKLTGMLPQDIQFINLKILEIKIDGYRVEKLAGYQGNNLGFRILVVFLPKYYLEKVEEIFKTNGFKNLKIIYPGKGLIPYFKEKREGIFLDVGGKITQFFLVKTGQIEKIGEFEGGGETFTQALSETLGLTMERARILKEDYSQKKLSEETSTRIKEILWNTLYFWSESLKRRLKNYDFFTPSLELGAVEDKEERKIGRPLPSHFYLFGGGSQLPDIKEILMNGNWEEVCLSKPKVEFIFEFPPKTINQGKNLINPQYIPALLSYYYLIDFSAGDIF